MGEVEEFDTLAFEKKLLQLKDTQESIQSLSSWCLKQRNYHKKIVSSWLNVLKRVKVEQRLTLFYLANDVIQYSKRKGYEFVESWGLNLQKATPLVRDEKVRPKILRIFKIWEQRGVYDEEFLTDLTGLLSAGAVKKTDDDPMDFQPQQLVNKIRQCTVLEADTDLRLKYIHENPLDLSDPEALSAELKDRSIKDDVEKELNEGIQCVERYTQALQREIVAREALLALLSSANQYYSTQRGEVKVVAYAYKNFGSRVRALKRKLDEMIPTLPCRVPSPPRRDEDVPSPGPDEDLDLPSNDQDGDEGDASYNIDRTFSTSVTADGSLYNLGLSSYLTSENPMTLFNETNDNVNSSANKIEVINNRPNEKQDFDINSFLKTFVPNDTNIAPDNGSVTSGSISQKSQDALPGLDLLTPDSTGIPPPPTSFYGSVDTLNDEGGESYHTDVGVSWNNSWSIPTAPLPVPPPPAPPSPLIAPLSAPPPAPLAAPPAPPPAPLAVFHEPPASPPPAPLVPLAPPPTISLPPAFTQSDFDGDTPPADVDHRGILPPPPPPPVLSMLGNIEDVDHRLLPTLPPPPPVTTSSNRHSLGQQDVDHRNLISLTHQPAPLRDMPLLQPGDQDYRVPPLVPPSDIVESVDMDLSEDEEHQGMYPGQSSNERRSSFNNNKVLVGGNDDKKKEINTNLIQINSTEEKPPSTPVLPLSNPFDKMPPGLKDFNMDFQNFAINFQKDKPLEEKEENSDDSAYDEDLRSRANSSATGYEEDLRSRGMETSENDSEFKINDNEWQQRAFTNSPRFPRNWAPRTNGVPQFRPPFGAAPMPGPMWRNGPRPPRWMVPRPPRFW